MYATDPNGRPVAGVDGQNKPFGVQPGFGGRRPMDYLFYDPVTKEWKPVPRRPE